jgi:hypothetical protein
LIDMALARLSMKFGKAGKAAAHAAYIAREAQYARRLHHGEGLEAKETGNLPAWADTEPNRFWQAADRHERANGTTYRELEIALPRELTPAQRLALVRGFVQQELGGRHAYQWAIHNPQAADGHEQPHVHLMFSERRVDGIDRDPERYFRRHNPKAPEKGGAKKGYGPYSGGYLSAAERVAHLKGLRQRWEIACNAALERAGRPERIDMRSHLERGSTIPPERKQLPSEWRQPATRAVVLAFRQARAERAAAQAGLNQALPNYSAAIIQLEAERQRRAEAAERQTVLQRRALDRIPMAFGEWLQHSDHQDHSHFQRTAGESWTAHRERILPLLRQIVSRLALEPHPAEAVHAVTERCYAALKAQVAKHEQQAEDAERHALETVISTLIAELPQRLDDEALAFFQAVKADAENAQQAEQWVLEALGESLCRRLREAGHTTPPTPERLDAAARRCYEPVMAQVATREARAQAERERAAAEDAERQRLLAVDLHALERDRAQWQTELETLQQARPPNAVQLATHWAGLTPAQAHRQTAHRQLEAVTDAFHGWNHSAASWFGLKRGERQAWEQRIQHAEDAITQAEHDYTAAQQRFHELLPAARDAVQRQAEQRQQQAAALQQRIDECEELMNHAARVQFEAHRQHLPQWPSSKPKPPTPRG